MRGQRTIFLKPVVSSFECNHLFAHLSDGTILHGMVEGRGLEGDQREMKLGVGTVLRPAQQGGLLGSENPAETGPVN